MIDFDYITKNWSSTDENVMQHIAEMRNEAVQEELNHKKTVDELNQEIQNLRTQNQSLNNTNISLVLRMTDPNNPLLRTEEEKETCIPSHDDYDSFLE